MKKSLIYLIHILYWIPSCIQIYVYFSFPDIQRSFTLLSIATLLAGFLSFYLFYLFLFPLISQRKFPAFILYGLAAIGIASILGVLCNKLMLQMSNFTDTRQTSGSTVISGIVLKALYSGIAACFVRGCITWYAELRYKRALEKKNLETELALLKAQLNPHFLFNTLNNIDILIEKDPVKASAYLKKLSDMIRFMLYESPAEKIPLTLEVNYIEQYIELQRIRTLNTDFVQFQVNGEITDLYIAPMLFIPFIENAFKHASNKKKSKAIEIQISINQKVIHFHCSNSVEQAFNSAQEQGGLGLSLIRSRLELLYAKKYEFNVDQSIDRFSVTLVLNLNEDELHYS
jgi:two-component system LytT family sensor kinase